MLLKSKKEISVLHFDKSDHVSKAMAIAMITPRVVYLFTRSKSVQLVNLRASFFDQK